MAAVESAIFGLLGVITGSLLATAKEWFFEHRKSEKDAKYLAILVSRELQRFRTACGEVVQEYNERAYYGHNPEYDTYASAIGTSPEFKPESIDVNWKSIPPRITDQIFFIPTEIETVHRYVGFMIGVGNSDQRDCDEELAFRFAGLGVKAIALANELRKTVGLPADKFSTKDGDDWLAEQVRDIEVIRSKRARVQNELTNSLNKQTEPPQSSRR
jgi:hypothetical protein